jgi:diguanylate cyclase (GGDEF)-like protein
MRIATITNWAYGVTLLLTFAAGGAFMAAVEADRQERVAIEEREAYRQIATRLDIVDARLRDQARLYAVRRTPEHKRAWLADMQSAAAVDAVVERLRSWPMPPVAHAALDEAERSFDRIEALETRAIAAVDAGRPEAARAMLYGPAYLALERDIERASAGFQSIVRADLDQKITAARLRADRWDDLAQALLLLTGLLFLGVLYFVLSRRVSRPLTHMTAVVNRLARRDYAADLPDDRRRDEIGEVTRAVRLFRQDSIERERLERERDEDRRIKDLIARMMHRMQGCDSEAELAEVVACYLPQAFPDLAGQLFVHDQAHGRLLSIGRWQEPALTLADFDPACCWGLRRGHPHRSNQRGEDVCCQHLDDPDGRDTLCVPLTAQAGVVGMLYLEAAAADGHYAERALYLDLISENVSLSLANIQLRAILSAMATRDPLTGLANRRHLDESFNRERALAESRKTPLAALMIDIDHFKRFNDEHGHDAGDMVMQHVAHALMAQTDAGDLACRYGGEEFTVLMPGADAQRAAARAEAIRQTIRKVALAHCGRSLPPVTVSIGVAAFPEQSDAASLLRVADGALLMAKSAGRDRVVIAGGTRPFDPDRIDAAA